MKKGFAQGLRELEKISCFTNLFQAFQFARYRIKKSLEQTACGVASADYGGDGAETRARRCLCLRATESALLDLLEDCRAALLQSRSIIIGLVALSVTVNSRATISWLLDPDQNVPAETKVAWEKVLGRQLTTN